MNTYESLAPETAVVNGQSGRQRLECRMAVCRAAIVGSTRVASLSGSRAAMASAV